MRSGAMAQVSLVWLLCITVVLIHEAHGQCGGTAQTLNGADLTTTQSFTIANPYSNNMVCEWLLQVSSPYNIFLRIDDISLEWYYDFVKIYDGSSTSSSILYNSLSRGATIFVSSGTDMFVRFTSDYSITYPGFTMTIIAVDRTSLPSCGDQITASTTETQLSYVGSQGSSCYFDISVGAGAVIQYKVPVAQNGVFNVDDSITQTYNDGISVYVSASNSFRVFATTQFVMNYVEVANNSTVNIVTSATTSTVSICTVSGTYLEALSSTDQYISSPNYPTSYGNNQWCAVTIFASSIDNSVSLVMDDWDLDAGDILNIYDGQNGQYELLGSYWSTGSTVNSTGRYLYIVFNSDSIAALRGFKVKYTEITRVIPSCASVYNSSNASSSAATITSPGYPGYYSNNIDVFWLIVKPSESDNLVMDITVMSIEESYQCVYDKLTIYDGSCTTDPVLAAVCGSTPITFEDSTGLYVLVWFKTDSSVVRTGFSMNYYIGTFVDDDEDGSVLEDWIIPLIVLVVIVVIVIGVVVFVWVMMYRNKRRQVGVRTGNMSSSSRPKLARKLTTHQLLMQFKSQYKRQHNGSRQNLGFQPPPGPPPPPLPAHHLPPNPPGPNTVFMNRSDMTPHPQPQPHGADPVYPPPNVLGNDSVMPKPIIPVLPAGQTFQPSAPPVIPVNPTPGVIPPPFNYITPREAREAAEAAAQAQSGALQ